MLPVINNSILQVEEKTYPSNTFAIDFISNKITGFVDEKEAIKQAIALILNTERYKFLIYSWNYGTEFEDLIGAHPDIVEDEIERIISEALLQDDRIKSVYDFDFKRVKDSIRVTLKVGTIFGVIEVETEVSL